MMPALSLGPTAVCIGSGPSLTGEDCEAVRHLPTIVTGSTSFHLCPWATVLMAHDSAWWREHGQEVARVFAGRKFGGTALAKRHGAESLYGTGFQWFGNTGCAAIHLAINSGARRILLLGFDACRGSDGRSHFFGSHPPSLSDCRSIKEWPAKFARVAALAQRRGVTVINCSRHTVLTCFERQTLEEALEMSEEAVAA